MLVESFFFREVRKFSVSAHVWTPAIRYHSLPDERWDLTLAAKRVYGDRNEWLAIMAAAGLDRLDSPLEEQLLVLPPLAVLAAIKRRTGYVSPAGGR